MTSYRLCPFCASDRVKPQDADGITPPLPGVAVVCLRCGARGPVVGNAGAAWSRWNKRRRAPRRPLLVREK